MKSAGYLTNHMARLFAQDLREKIAPLGLAPAQFMALLELWNEDGLTQRQLVERLDVEQATIANTITRMERDGLIERRPHPSDRRARTIFATRKARSLKADAIAAAREVNRSFLEALPPGKQNQLLEFMQQIVDSRKNKNS